MLESTPVESAPTPPPPAPRPELAGESFGEAFRRAITVAVLFVSIFIFVRTFALEPFGVPTGSMAPKLIGNHRETTCPRCTHPIIVGEVPGHDRPANACCPNCGKFNISLEQTWEIPGDRLLVDKNVFNVRSPRRWEVTVFRCPVDLSKPYVKRAIGLPFEEVQLVGGDIFIDGEVSRKTLAQLREMRVPVFSQVHVPVGSWKDRWLVEPTAGKRLSEKARPATEEILSGTALRLDATTAERPTLGLTYRNWDLDEKTERPITDWLSYNGPPKRGRSLPVHDFMLSCRIVVMSGTGSFACRLGDGLDSVSLELPIGTPGEAKLTVDKNDKLTMQKSLQLVPGQSYELEFAFIDRRAMVAVQGVELMAPLDLPATRDRYSQRGQVSRPLQLGASGVCLELHDLRLWRDIHYRPEGVNGTQTPYKLGANEYFVLGDNSSNSLDSREWATPAVRTQDLIGKPFVIHQPLKAGRVAVNGGTKSFQTVDWERLRWVR